MKAARPRNTAAELALREALGSYELAYLMDEPVLPGLQRRADMVFQRERVAVFVDGCFWHGCPTHGTWPKQNAEFWREKIEANGRRDMDTDLRLELEGWRSVRIWEHEEPHEAAHRVAAIVVERRR
jgi:DNA mismatch endonuclease (patch repair protein)